MFDKALFPDLDCEGPGGVPMKDAVAKAVSAALKAHGKTDDEPIVKLATTAEVSVENDRTEISKVTTEAVDKDREVIIAKGVDLTAFQSNPVVLLNHDWKSLPIGKALWIKDHGNGLTAKTQYAKRPSEHKGEWLPESVYSLIKQSMLPGKSIGFLPLEARSPTKAEIQSRPELKEVRRIFSKTLMVEYSVVSVPSNHEALVEAVGKSFPALAALLGVKAPEDVDDEDDDDEDHIALVRRIATEFPNPGELQEAVAWYKTVGGYADQLERLAKALEDIDTLKQGYRDIRKQSLNFKPPKPEPQPVDVGRLHEAIKRNFAKMA